MTNRSRKFGPKEDLILERWKDCQTQSAGESELKLIQKALKEELRVVESPARIARTLADHEIPLRHPEIIETDCIWREEQSKRWRDLYELDFDSIPSALSSMKRLEQLRKRFWSVGDKASTQIVVEHARELKKQLTHSSTDLAGELAHWVTIWLQNPEIFEDWLELRRKSPEFRKRFATARELA